MFKLSMILIYQVDLKENNEWVSKCLNICISDTTVWEICLSLSLQYDMCWSLLYSEANIKWQSENNMAGIEGMKDGSHPERDRPVISKSTTQTLISVSSSEHYGKRK